MGHLSIHATKPKEVCGHPALSCGTGRGFSGSLINGGKANPEIYTMYASLVSVCPAILTIADAWRAADQPPCGLQPLGYESKNSLRTEHLLNRKEIVLSTRSRISFGMFIHQDCGFGSRACKLTLGILGRQLLTGVRGSGPYMRFGLSREIFRSPGHGRSSCSLDCFI